jgi:hypothetical protein
MASYFVLNSRQVGLVFHFAGELIDDAQVDLAPLTAAGCRLIPTSNSSAAAAAAICQSIRKQGGDPETCTGIMLASQVAGVV